MHKLLMAILLLGSTNQVMFAAGWTPVSYAQAERDAIMSKFKKLQSTICNNMKYPWKRFECFRL